MFVNVNFESEFLIIRFSLAKLYRFRYVLKVCWAENFYSEALLILWLDQLDILNKERIAYNFYLYTSIERKTQAQSL